MSLKLCRAPQARYCALAPLAPTSDASRTQLLELILAYSQLKERVGSRAATVRLAEVPAPPAADTAACTAACAAACHATRVPTSSATSLQVAPRQRALKPPASHSSSGSLSDVHRSGAAKGGRERGPEDGSPHAGRGDAAQHQGRTRADRAGERVLLFWGGPSQWGHFTCCSCGSADGEQGEQVLHPACAGLNHRTAPSPPPPPPLQHFAAAGGHAAIVSALIKANASVDAKTMGGETPLHAAAAAGQADAVAALLEGGAAVDAQTPKHLTPLLLAAAKGHAGACAALLAGGADPSLRSPQGALPMLLAIQVSRTVGGVCVGVGVVCVWGWGWGGVGGW